MDNLRWIFFGTGKYRIQTGLIYCTNKLVMYRYVLEFVLFINIMQLKNNCSTRILSKVMHVNTIPSDRGRFV